jgi:hypothetical protein
MPFKKIILFLSLIAAIAWGWVYGLPNMAQGRINSYLSEAGYKPHGMGEIIVRPPYILVRDIQLDKDGFNTIGLLRAKVHGLGMEVDEIRIDDLRTSTTVETLPSVLRLIGTFQKALPPGVVHIEKMTSDFATPYGDLRLESTVNLEAADAEGKRAITSIVKARQYQLSFDTRWSGTLGPNAAMNLDADILDGRLNIGPARLARLMGWFSWNSQTEGIASLAGQIDAGSGTLFNLPLQNISLTVGGTAQSADLLFRTGLSGTTSMLLSADTKITPTNSTFDAVLDIADSDAFFTHIHTLRPKEAPEILRALGPFRLSMDYREDRRFEGGPFPFELTANAAAGSILKGNILFYPDTLEMRGSAEMDETLATALQEYLSIAKEKRTGGALRLDGQLKDLLATEEKK